MSIKIKKILTIFLLTMGFCSVPLLAFVVFLFKLPSSEAIYMADLLVAFGTISMALVIVYIEIIKPWGKKPRITIEFDNKAPFCRNATPEGERDSWEYFRVKVTNIGNSAAKKVRGKLVELDTGNTVVNEFFDPLSLHWTSIEPVRGLEKLGFAVSTKYLDSIDLGAKEWDYLDVFSLGGGSGDEIKIATSPQPRGCLKQFGLRDRAVFKITVFVDNIDPVSKRYQLVWQDHGRVRMFEVKNGI